MSYFQIIYDSNRYVRRLARMLGFGYSYSSEVRTSRFIEYSWVLRNLDVPFGRMLDVGSTGSTFPILLASFGYDVYSIDVREYEWKTHPNLTAVVGDIRKTEFPNRFFDRVTAVSTIEHVGLGRYGDPLDPDGDRKALLEIARILKPQGKLLMTMPFGRMAVSKLHRVYDKETLKTLVEGFKVEKMELFGVKDGYWFRSKEEELVNVDSSRGERAIACMKLSKLRTTSNNSVGERP